MFRPGDLVKAAHRMRSWVDDHERGKDGLWIEEDALATVVETWNVGGRVRMRLLVAGRLVVVSHSRSSVPLNWTVVD